MRLPVGTDKKIHYRLPFDEFPRLTYEALEMLSEKVRNKGEIYS